jgi:AcrR family transcriptional regulator
MRKKEKSFLRDNLLEHSEEMFIRHGITCLTMDHIAKKLGMSKKTIYSLVRDKSHLVLEVIERYVQKEKKINEKIRLTAQNPIEEMVLVMAHILQQTKELNPQVVFDLQKYYPESWQVYHHYRNSYMIEFISANIKKGVENGFYRSDFNIDMITKFYIGALNIITDQTLFPSKHYKFVNILKEFIQYHLRAIVSAKGLEELQIHQKNNIKSYL